MRDCLVRRWWHSFEEDNGDERVYRPAEFAFPPARGRAGFELRSDGTLVDAPIGRGDAPRADAGQWALAGDRLELTTARRRRVVIVVRCDDTVLVLREEGSA